MLSLDLIKWCYYCKLIFKDEQNKPLFNFKQIKENFQFFLNANRNQNCQKLIDICTVYRKDDKFIRISFNGYE